MGPTFVRTPTQVVLLVSTAAVTFGDRLTMQLDALKPRMMALNANRTVTRYFGFVYTASRYTFSPPERGNMVPSSSQMKSPQIDMKNPRSQSMRDAPTDPTDPRIDDGVEKIAVPIIRPILYRDA